MSRQAPPIEPRTAAQIAARAAELAQRYAGWRPPADGSADMGVALIRIFARLSELLIERINQVPDKHFIAFLDLIGVQLNPPQPARVPLTFQLASGTTAGVLVPAYTQVAAPASQGSPEVIFETERDLLLTPAQLQAVFVRRPDADTYADHTAEALGLHDASFPAFSADQPIEHSLYLACEALTALPGEKDLAIRFASPDAPILASLPLMWAAWDGTAWKTLVASTATPDAQTWQVTLSNLSIPESVVVGGRSARWLRASLTQPLPVHQILGDQPTDALLQIARHQINADGAYSGGAALNPDGQFSPFGQGANEGFSREFYVASDEVFTRAGAAFSLDVDLAQPGGGSGLLLLIWYYWAGNTWSEIGRSSRTTTATGTVSEGFNDGTQGFTRSGTVQLRVPPGWQPTMLHDDTRSRRWLRVEVRSGDYGSGENARQPRVRRMVLSYSWSLPRMDAVSLSASIRRAATLAPDLLVTNETQVELTKDLYPFGEQPRFNDTFAIASAEAFARPGGVVTIQIDVRNPVGQSNLPVPAVNATEGIEIVWELGNGRTWRELGRSSATQDVIGTSNFSLQDTTRALTKSGVVGFKLPTELSPIAVAGTTSTWVRARIARGGYGRPSYYEVVTRNGIQGYEPRPATLAPPLIAALRIGYTYNSTPMPLDACISRNDFVERGHTATANRADGVTFLPFVPTRDTKPALYLGFDRPFANAPMTLYVLVKPQPYDESLISSDLIDAAPQGELVSSTLRTNPPQVSWEYASESGWRSLGAEDATRAFAERGLVSFIGPADALAQTMFDRHCFWLRARWAEGSYLAIPQLRRIQTNTTWAVQATTARDEVLGSSDGSPDQVVRTTRAPVLNGQAIVVDERESLPPEERSALEQREGPDVIRVLTDATGWVRGYRVRWRAVPDFHGSGPRDRHYVIDNLTGAIRFGNGRQGLIPPLGRDNIRAQRYRTGGGAAGNLPGGRISQLTSAIAYVDRVSQLEPALGGFQQETIAQVKERGPKTLRHRGRAVTAQDFEELAYEASASVARVKAITPQFNPLEPGWIETKAAVVGDVNAYQAVAAGQVGLLLVPYSTEQKPMPSLELIDRVDDYIRARCSPLLQFWLAGPDWAAVQIEVEVAPRSLATSGTLAVEVLAALQGFLHPLTGGTEGGGWAFGRRPQRSDLYRLIEGLAGVAYVRTLRITFEPNQPERPERCLVYSGLHQVRLVAAEEQN